MNKEILLEDVVSRIKIEFKKDYESREFTAKDCAISNLGSGYMMINEYLSDICASHFLDRIPVWYSYLAAGNKEIPKISEIELVRYLGKTILKELEKDKIISSIEEFPLIPCGNPEQDLDKYPIHFYYLTNLGKGRLEKIKEMDERVRKSLERRLSK